MTRLPLAAWALALGACAAAAAPDAGNHPAPRADARPERGSTCSLAPPAPDHIARVVVRGATDGAQACARLRTFAGSPYDAVRSDADLRALFATGTFEDVVVAREEDVRGIAIVFEVVERPLLTALAVRGATSPPALEATRELPPAPPRVDPVWIRKVARDLTDDLRYAGFRDAEVRYTVEGGKLAFQITEGPRSLLDRLRFEGLRIAGERAVRSKLRLADGEPVSDALIERDRLTVQHALFDLGLLDNRVTPEVAIDPRDHRATVTFHVVEGARYRIGSVKLSVPVSEPIRAAILRRLKAGSVVTLEAISNSVDDIQLELSKTGTPGEVVRDVRVDAKRSLADIELRLEAR